MSFPRSVLPILLLAFAAPLHAQSAGETPPILSHECEVDLALSAAPAHLREGAGVWAFGEHGYEEARPSENGFTCIVNRDWPLSLKPVCYDAAGGEAILPKVVLWGRLLAAGLPVPTITDSVAAAFDRAQLHPPKRAGVAYMLSSYNRPFGPRRQALGWFPPHVMFYAPDLTNADIGSPPQPMRASPPLPFVAYQGPQGFMILVDSQAFTDDPVEVPACTSELGPPGPPKDDPRYRKAP